MKHRQSTADAWAEVERSARECWRIIIEALKGRKGR